MGQTTPAAGALVTKVATHLMRRELMQQAIRDKEPRDLRDADGGGLAGKLSVHVQAEVASLGNAGAAGTGQVAPAVIMEALAQNATKQLVTTTLLLQRATQLALGTKLRSLFTASSALWMWHMFAAAAEIGRTRDGVGGSLQELWNYLTVYCSSTVGVGKLRSMQQLGHRQDQHGAQRREEQLNTVGTTLTMQALLVTNVVNEVVQFAQNDKAIAARSRKADTQRYASTRRRNWS